MTAEKKRIVIVTGAGIGIGAATAKAFGALGDHVVVTDILEKEGREVAEAISAAGGSAEFHRYDVRSTAEADALTTDGRASMSLRPFLVRFATVTTSA